ncbi:tail protein X [Orrella dioscoreae]|uniref:Phage tail completion protein n=1 Tax=Orrella dioscoreae TaxID=1851544 RepID=A0A1C3K397_9BURK|nr:tail protein X [Orrella dioscoreae]SBT25981.1 Phage tail completion protein [Orrella dioscoreae]SOE50859.1 Phage tail completion protein [Orrella dioscoreae]
MQARSIQGETLDALCWRVLRTTRGVVERALEMNPGLADIGPILPSGTLVELPEPTTEPTTAPTVNLWD